MKTLRRKRRDPVSAVQEAWQRGYSAGLNGHVEGNAPYLNVPGTERLISEWNAGRDRGLQQRDIDRLKQGA